VVVDGDDVAGHGVGIGEDGEVETLDDEVARRGADEERLVDVTAAEGPHRSGTGPGGEPLRRSPRIVGSTVHRRSLCRASASVR